MASKKTNKKMNISLSNSYDWVFPVMITYVGDTECWVKYPDFPEYPEYILEKYDEDFIRGRLVNLIYSKYDNLNRVPKPKDISIKIDDIFSKNTMIKLIGINKKDIFDQFDTNRINITVSIPFYLNEILKNNDFDLDKVMIIGILKKLNLV